jgi:pimeloyl-ACP methyl ester carboxylesterase
VIGRAALVAAALALGACPSFHAGRLPGAPADATFAEVDGVHLHYRAVGSGPAVVMIHGYGASLDLWRPVQDALAAHHRVIAVDLKGFGWSSRPPGDYSPRGRGPARVGPARSARGRSGLDRRPLVGLVGQPGHGAGPTRAGPPHRALRRLRVRCPEAAFFRWAGLDGIGEVLFALNYRANVEERIGLAYHDPRFITQARVDHVVAELGRPGTTAAALAAARDHELSRLEARYREIAQPTLLLWGRRRSGDAAQLRSASGQPPA